MNQNRRNFLRFILIGTGVFVIGKLLASNLPLFKSQEKELSLGEKFKVTEEGGKLIFFNQKGEKIFTLNEEGEIEVGE